MRGRDFERRLAELLRAPVAGWSSADKAAAVARHLDGLRANGTAMRFEARFEPFVPGRRPDDEAAYPGLGSSEHVGLYNPARAPSDHLKLLLRCAGEGRASSGLPPNAVALATIALVDENDDTTGTLEGWTRRDVTGLLVAAGAPPAPVPGAIYPALQLDLAVNDVFAPPSNVDAERWLGFQRLFHQRFRVVLDVEIDGARIAGDEILVDIYDERAFGSLYRRLLETLLEFDTDRQRQGARAGCQLTTANHPWFPVLYIGSQKARLYMESVAADLVAQGRALTDPGWLLRIGLYLELLTAFGVVEAVRDEIDLLTAAERDAFENNPAFGEIRNRVDVQSWRAVWDMREIGLTRRGAPGAANLLRKKRATFAFLQAHHADLKHAIELAGANFHNAQETWHRVFRDAERAVLQTSRDAFPELFELPAAAREFALWHESGSVGGVRVVPRRLTEMFGDQDGVFPSACRQYRASMNHVAEWASSHGLMEYIGDECIPPSASLLEAHISRQRLLFDRLQRRDGFAGSLEVRHEDGDEAIVDRDTILRRLQEIGILSALTADELGIIADGVRPILLGHLERIIIQGREGSSLFILQEGELEVIEHSATGDRQLAVLAPPAIVGELAFLLDEPRGATVRAVNHAVVLEIGAGRLRPFVEARPQVIDALTSLLKERRRDNASDSRRLRARIRRTIFAGSEVPPAPLPRSVGSAGG
jgi:CRP-like cAMP-binding protein